MLRAWLRNAVEAPGMVLTACSLLTSAGRAKTSALSAISM